ncbi:hypothetical protein MMC20_003374 [Loxospora ochrophaea]|nr:hypothetical protein [Loxospora ochrophaea]
MLNKLLLLLQNGVLPLLLALWVATPRSTPLHITMGVTALVTFILHLASGPTIRVSSPPTPVIQPLNHSTRQPAVNPLQLISYGPHTTAANKHDRHVLFRLQHEAEMEALSERYRILEEEYRASFQTMKEFAESKEGKMDKVDQMFREARSGTQM